jgi:hypothetical protein
MESERRIFQGSQLLRSPDIKPSSDVVAKALGEANKAYIKFVNELANHDIRIEWRYYCDGKAWLAKGLYNWTGIRGGQNETTVFWLSIWEGFFQLFLNYIRMNCLKRFFRFLILGKALNRGLIYGNEKVHYCNTIGS